MPKWHKICFATNNIFKIVYIFPQLNNILACLVWKKFVPIISLMVSLFWKFVGGDGLIKLIISLESLESLETVESVDKLISSVNESTFLLFDCRKYDLNSRKLS